jgi:hypothetical protein
MFPRTPQSQQKSNYTQYIPSRADATEAPSLLQLIDLGRNNIAAGHGHASISATTISAVLLAKKDGIIYLARSLAAAGSPVKSSSRPRREGALISSRRVLCGASVLSRLANTQFSLPCGPQRVKARCKAGAPGSRAQTAFAIRHRKSACCSTAGLDQECRPGRNYLT